MQQIYQADRLSWFGSARHGKGGGGSAPAPSGQNTVSTSTSLPTYAQPYFEDLMSQTQAVTQDPYQAYTGQRVAGFGSDTLAGFQDIHNLNAQGTGTFDSAAAAAGALTNQQGGTFDATQAANYMNPYIGNVLDTTEARMQQHFQEQQAGRDADAVNKGAFGGSRAALTTSQAQRDLNDQMNQMAASQYGQAYNNAEGQYNADRAAQLQANSQSVQAAGAQGQLAQMGQSAGLQQANAEMQAGAMQQTQNQNQLDTAYQDFVNQRDFPRQQLNFYSSILHGVPISAQSETVSTAAPQNPLNQMLGLGVAGLGAYKALGGSA